MLLLLPKQLRRAHHGGEKHARTGPDDPGPAPIVQEKADEQVNRNNHAPVNPGNGTRSAALLLALDGIVPLLEELLEAALDGPRPDQQPYAAGNQEQQHVHGKEDRKVVRLKGHDQKQRNHAGNAQQHAGNRCQRRADGKGQRDRRVDVDAHQLGSAAVLRHSLRCIPFPQKN